MRETYGREQQKEKRQQQQQQQQQATHSATQTALKQSSVSKNEER